MKAEHRHELEQNALNRGLTQFAEKAKSGEFLNTRTYLILAAVLLLGGAGVYLWYAGKEHRKATAGMWMEITHIAGPAGLEEFAKDTKDPTAARVARLQLARVWLGPDGLQKLASINSDARRTAIDSVEKARKEFEKLADEFKDDLTLKAQCLDGQAHAELALVGIPKEGTFDQYRGTVSRAVELFKEYAKLVGESTKTGEEAVKKADDLSKNEQEVLRVAQALNNRLTPPPTTNIELPKPPFDLKSGLPPANTPPKTPDTLPPPTIPPPPAPQKAPDTKAPAPPASGTPAAPTPPPPTTKK